MITSRWRVGFTPAELLSPSSPLPFVAELPGDWEESLRRAEVVPGTPFLLSPTLEYDVALNGFFQNASASGACQPGSGSRPTRKTVLRPSSPKNGTSSPVTVRATGGGGSYDRPGTGAG
jgi:hypothetical protein